MANGADIFGGLSQSISQTGQFIAGSFLENQRFQQRQALQQQQFTQQQGLQQQRIDQQASMNEFSQDMRILQSLGELGKSKFRSTDQTVERYNAKIKIINKYAPELGLGDVTAAEADDPQLGKIIKE